MPSHLTAHGIALAYATATSQGKLPALASSSRLRSRHAHRRHSSCAVGRNRISFTSTSSGWPMAKATMRAKLSAGMATAS